jgi:hypothetical protein
MSTLERIQIAGDIEVDCDCDWEFERNPFDKEAAHYHGEDDSWFLRSWEVVNGVELTPKQVVEVDDELNRQGPNI